MTEKEFRKLKTLDLIQILLRQSAEVAEQQKDLDGMSVQLELLLEENEIIKAKLDDRDAMTEVIKKKLDESDERIRVLEEEVKNLYSDRQITLKETGSLVQAALELNKIFELAQREAEQYIYNVERRIGARRFKALGIMEEFEELRQLERAITPVTQPQMVQPAAGGRPAVKPVTAKRQLTEPIMAERQSRPAEPMIEKELVIEPIVSEERAAEPMIEKELVIEPIVGEERAAESVIDRDIDIDRDKEMMDIDSLEEPEEGSIEEDNGLLRPDDFKKLLEQEGPQSSQPVSEGPEPPWKREALQEQSPEPPWKQQEAPPWPELPQKPTPATQSGQTPQPNQAVQPEPEPEPPQKPAPSRPKGLFGIFRRKR